MVVTDDVSQSPMDALKAVAATNVLTMSVTCDTSQAPMDALKAVASRNA